MSGASMAEGPLVRTACGACGATVSGALAETEPLRRLACPACGAETFLSRYERIDIGLSEVCNLACNMCRRPQEKAFMAPARVERLLAEARAIGVRTISFSGGEPFVHPQFRRFLSLAVGHGFAVELVTNGTLVRPSDLPLLEQLRCVTVSVDGPEATHDEIRGLAGAWRRTMAALALLAGSRAKWGVNTVIQAQNAHEILATWAAVRAVGRPAYVAFTHVEVVPETAHLQPGAGQVPGIKAQLAAIREACARDHVHFNDEALVTGLYDIFADKRRRYRPLGGCRIPSSFLGISQHGIFPCWHQGRAIQAAGLIEALESDLCRSILAEGLERRCIGCNAANYSWSETWISGIAAAARNAQWDEGVVYLAESERAAGRLTEGRRTLPILERRGRAGRP